MSENTGAETGARDAHGADLRGADVREATARGYDQLAPMYDAAVAQNRVAVWMREQLWQHYARVFSQHARVLDFSAGTGADTLYLAARGNTVVALDVSAGMLDELKRRAAERALSVETHVLAAEDLDKLQCVRFDGALSSFAGLNTMQNLDMLAANLARLVKPRGRVVVHALNKFCLWDALSRTMRRRPARGDTLVVQLGGVPVPHTLYDPLKLYRAHFCREFVLRELYALSVIAAPIWFERAGKFAPFVLYGDRALGRLATRAGDFFVMDLERR